MKTAEISVFRELLFVRIKSGVQMMLDGTPPTRDDLALVQALCAAHFVAMVEEDKSDDGLSVTGLLLRVDEARQYLDIYASNKLVNASCVENVRVILKEILAEGGEA